MTTHEYGLLEHTIDELCIDRLPGSADADMLCYQVSVTCEFTYDDTGWVNPCEYRVLSAQIWTGEDTTRSALEEECKVIGNWLNQSESWVAYLDEKCCECVN